MTDPVRGRIEVERWEIVENTACGNKGAIFHFSGHGHFDRRTAPHRSRQTSKREEDSEHDSVMSRSFTISAPTVFGLYDATSCLLARPLGGSRSHLVAPVVRLRHRTNRRTTNFSPNGAGGKRTERRVLDAVLFEWMSN